MKKKLEADLISIAHRILKLKNKSELTQLHQETQKLYEKLSVLLFVENHFQEAKPTIGLAKIEEDLAVAFDAFDADTVKVPVVEALEPKVEIPAPVEAVTTPLAEIEIPLEKEVEVLSTEASFLKKEEEPVVMAEETATTKPHFELFKEDVAIATPNTKKELHQISFEELLGTTMEPIFERVVHKEIEKATEIKEELEIPVESITPINEDTEKLVSSIEANTDLKSATENHTLSNEETEALLSRIEAKSELKLATENHTLSNEDTEALLSKIEKNSELKSAVINESNNNQSKTISFGLNDRIAFEKQLFGGSSEDLNRVISQLSTYDTLQEAHDFIEEMVKPDYNNWEGKDEYIHRFMAVVENKFS